MISLEHDIDDDDDDKDNYDADDDLWNLLKEKIY